FSTVGLAVMQHPAVMGYQISDEPYDEDIPGLASQYAAYKTNWPGRPCLTDMVGEASAFTSRNVAMTWQRIGAEQRIWRYFPFRKSCYDLLTVQAFERHMEGPDIFAWMSSLTNTPWYYVPQTFSNNPQSAEPFRRNPTGSELVASLHLALAFGAQGYFCWPFQSTPEQYGDTALVEPLTLLPV